MWMPRLIVLSLLLAGAACTSAPAPRDVEPVVRVSVPAAQAAPEAAAAHPSAQNVVAAMTERCRATVGNHQNASVSGTPTAVLMRDDWVQVDGIVEWKAESGEVARNAWTCDMFRDESGVWQRRYLSFGPG